MNFNSQYEDQFDPTKQQFVNHGYSSQGIHGQMSVGYPSASSSNHQNFQQQLQQMHVVEGQLVTHGSKRNLQKKQSHQNANSVRFRRQYMATGKSNLGTSQNLSNNSSFKSNAGHQQTDPDRQNGVNGARDKSVNQRDIHNRVLSNGPAIGGTGPPNLQLNNTQQYRVQLHGQTISPKNIKNPSQVQNSQKPSQLNNFSSDLHLPGALDFMGAQTGMYPNGIGSIMPNSVQNATTIRNHGNQSVTNAMQAQLITPKNSNFGGLQQFGNSQAIATQHGAMIQGGNNNRINQVIKKHSINSGRTRGQMNSTTLRQEGNGSSNAARMIIKKTVSPSNDSMTNQQLYYQQQNSQQSTGQKFGSKLSKNVNAAQQVYQPSNYHNGSNLPISSRSNRNGMVQFANQNTRSKNSKNNLDARKVPTPKNQGGSNQNPIWQFNVQNSKQGSQNQDRVEFQIKKNSRNFGSTSNPSQNQNMNMQSHEKQLMLSNNINSYREVLTDQFRSPQGPSFPINDFGIPNIGAYPQSVTNAQGVGSGLLQASQKRNIQLTNLKMGLQQFPPVPGVGGPGSPNQATNEASYTAVLKARQSVGKRSQNRTINDNPTTNDSSVGSPLNVNMKTIDLNTYLEQNTRVASQEDHHHNQRYISNSQSSKQSVGMVSISQNSQHKKYGQQTGGGGSTFPMTSEDALRIYGRNLSQYERDEIASFEVIYYLNLNAKHKGVGQFIKGEINSQDENPNPNADHSSIYNHGFDNDQADYLYEAKEQINYRYEIQKKLGKGAFGVVVRCFDHKCKEVVALKILKNWKKLHKQGKIEIKILETLRDKDHENSKNIVRIKDSFTFRSHVFISFEMLSINLYQFIKNNDFQGFSMALTKRFSIQVLEALDYMFQFSIVHCDLKPENILLVKPNKSQIKLIDYGSSCFELERFYTYIQSRFYRAPEIMLGIPYTTAIDMWSFGCIVFECLVGVPIFAGENENDQMAAIMEVVGVPPRSLIAKASRRRVFFDDDYHPILIPNSRGKVRHPQTRSLADALKINDPDLIEFMKACFEWKPEKRLKPNEALQMPWIQKSLSESRTRAKTKPSD